MLVERIGKMPREPYWKLGQVIKLVILQYFEPALRLFGKPGRVRMLTDERRFDEIGRAIDYPSQRAGGTRAVLVDST